MKIKRTFSREDLENQLYHLILYRKKWEKSKEGMIPILATYSAAICQPNVTSGLKHDWQLVIDK